MQKTALLCVRIHFEPQEPHRFGNAVERFIALISRHPKRWGPWLSIVFVHEFRVAVNGVLGKKERNQW